MSQEKKQIRETFRQAVFERDGHRCVMCGKRDGKRGPLDQSGEMHFRIAVQQLQQPRRIGAYQIEQIGRGFRNAVKDGADARKPRRAIADRARAVGKSIAERAKDKGVSAVVFDRGGYLYHGRVKALADAAREAGLEF